MALDDTLEVGERVGGGVCAALGFASAGVRCGIKRKRRDIAVLHSTNGDAVCAGVFTQNVACAPNVIRNRALLTTGGNLVRAIVVNSGNANTGNGPQGEQANRAMAQLAAGALAVSPEKVLTASTGIIGTPLPMNLVTQGIREATQSVAHSDEASANAAEAILTTDTFAKEYALRFALGGHMVHVGGIAKGSGMIAPNMATMLAFITTDAAIASDALTAALKEAVAVSFNALTVDGDTSTSDTCLLLSSGAAGNPPITDMDGADYRTFTNALTAVCVHLAKEVARDGEGATKLVTVRVMGAPNVVSARQVAKTVAESPLVKTALFGNDPNWGRLLMAAGRAGVPFDPNKLVIALAGHMLYTNGMPAAFDRAKVAEDMSAKEVEILLDLQGGMGQATVYTCDFSYDYVRINAEYHT